ncbi:MAG: mechanosensitive ion channel domain-containing protein [Pseudomonadota bacterium]
MVRNLVAACLLVWAIVLVPAPSSAQAQLVTGSTSSAAEDGSAEEVDLSSPEAINAAVARLSDDEVRALLLDQLNANATTEAAAEPASAIDRIARLWSAFTSPPVAAVQRIPLLFQRQGDAFTNFAQTYGGPSGVLTLFGLTAIMLAAGLLVEQVARMLMDRWRVLDVRADDSSLWSALSYLFRRFLREVVGLFIFYSVARAVGRGILSPEQAQFAAIFATYLVWFPRLGAAFSRFVLAPKRPDMRLVNVDDRWAGYLHRNIIGLVLLGGFTIFMVEFNAANGVPMGETRLGFWLDSAVYVYIIIIALTARDGLIDLMRGTDPDQSRFDEFVSVNYPYFAMVVAAAMWVIVTILAGLGQLSLLIQGAHYTTLFWLLVTPAFDTAIRGLVRHLVPPMSGEGAIAEMAYQSTKRSYIRIGRVLVMGAVVLIIAGAWDLDLGIGEGERPGVGDNLVGFLMTLVIGYITYEVVSLWINRRLAAEQTSREVTSDEIGGEGGGGSGSRLATVLPLVRMTAQGAILVIFGLLAIGNLGVDITPLLAGAGILGLAIGFGAQKLVSDVVSGIFFLIDDAFRVGEYVEIDSTRGAVEKISIRSMQLRHHRGPVHTIPYGEIPQLTNYSRDWVIMKLRFTVPFDTDPNKVKKIFKKIGAEMREDPLYKDDFLEPFKSQGVFEFDDVGMVIRGKFMAKPGKQFTIRKEVYNRVKAEFDAAGIDFARREVRVAIPNMDEDGVSEAEQVAIRAAAAEAVQQEVRQKAETQGS